MTPPPKSCASCGRRIEWRKKWERDWDQVRYCSTACRRRGVTEADQALEARLRELLAKSRSVDVAQVGDDADPEPARRAARRLVAAGEVVMTQKGKVVDPSTAKGPVQVRRA